MVKRAEFFDYVIVALLLLIGLVSVFPLLFVLSVSLTPYSEVIRNGGFLLIPHTFTLEAYRSLLAKSDIPRALGITVWITVLGTTINMYLSTVLAYPLSRKYLPGRSLFLLMVVFTLLFSGGLIPTYLIVKATGLLNTIWSLIIPTAVWSFNVLIMKSFFSNLPEELFEAAKMDGAKEGTLMWRIAVPLSVPVLVTMGLFYAVGHWNEYFQAIMYISNNSLFPLQVVVREILDISEQQLLEAEQVIPTVTLQMAAVVFASLPIILVYPFLQRYLVKGMLLGSIKG